MKICVAVFRSRTQVFSFIEAMRDLGISCSSITTPKEASIGCGISAQFSPLYLSTATAVIKRKGFSAFYGFFVITKVGGKTTTVRF